MMDGNNHDVVFLTSIMMMVPTTTKPKLKSPSASCLFLFPQEDKRHPSFHRPYYSRPTGKKRSQSTSQYYGSKKDLRRLGPGIIFLIEVKTKKKKKKKKKTRSAGLEPTRDKPNRFLVDRLNRSATTVSMDAHLLLSVRPQLRLVDFLLYKQLAYQSLRTPLTSVVQGTNVVLSRQLKCDKTC